MIRAALVVCVISCGARPGPLRHTAVGDDLTLFRDLALIRQRVELDLPAGSATVTVRVAGGVRSGELVVLDRGGIRVTAVHVADPRAEPRPPASPLEPAELEEDTDDDVADDDVGHDDGEPSLEPRSAADAGPTVIRLDIDAPRAGRYAIVLGYATDRLRWTAAYTMTANAARDRAVLRGALAIENQSGITYRAARARVVDAELAAWRGKAAEQLAADLAGGAEGSIPPAAPRELGALTIGDSELRVELLPPRSRRMSSVLVYDPIGTRLDNASATPLVDPQLGTAPVPTRVIESFEIPRHEATTRGLPAGPVRLLEARADGSLALLGEARLFEPAARVAGVDTIPVGPADGVTGSRERRELTVDTANQQIIEEFAITLDNQRDHSVGVLVREHLYRGQNWRLPYHSAASAEKEGPQQIALRARVPARSKIKILYVVVYTWGQ